MENAPIEQNRRNATAVEIETLLHVLDSVPFIVWVALVAGAAERFTFYAVASPWRKLSTPHLPSCDRIVPGTDTSYVENYIQNSRDNIAVPGALGLGQSSATNISNAFYFFSFLAPIPFAIVSDTWLGRYKTLRISFV